MPDTKWTPPRAMVDLLEEATRFGRSTSVVHASDIGGALYVTARVRWTRPGDRTPVEIRAVWHTRPTGEYRVRSCMARWPGQDWTDVSLTRAVALVADGAELLPPPEDAPDPAQEWAQVWGDSWLAAELGTQLTCREANVLADLLASLGLPQQALMWLVEHALGDDEGDDHWELREQYPAGVA